MQADKDKVGSKQGSKKGKTKRKTKQKMKNINFEKILQVEQEAQKKSSTIREFILLTLIHAEARLLIDGKTIINRIKELFECRAIVVATEKHQERGTHYHVGIWAKNASKNTLRNKLRKEFSEWPGRAIDISLHKGWGSICLYILKEDKEPLVWGEFTLDHIKTFAHAHETKKAANLEIGNVALLKKLEQIEDWYQVYRDDILANKVLQNLPRMKEAFEDLKTLKDIETNVFSRIIEYLKEKGNPREYDVEEIREKYLVIDWIACQLCFRRPIKTKQLFIYGEPSTQKTLLMHCLAKVINIYFASSRRNDFAGASDHYDLWVFDEFHEQEQQSEQEGTMRGWGGATMEGSTFVNNLLKVLDGQECRLDSKYSRVFKKKRNVPIIMIANKLPQLMEKHGPFRARFFRIRFSTQIKNLEEERIIATLWGCLVRRATRSPYANEKETPGEVTLAYNESSALILPGEKREKENGERIFANNTDEWMNAIKKVENPISEKKDKKEIEKIMNNKTVLINKEGGFYMLKPKIIEVRKQYNIIIFEILKIEEIQWEENKNKVYLLNFATIPIKKKEEGNEKKKNPLKELFEQLEERGEHQEEKEESTEEGERESITRLKSIFMDNKEREWIKKEKRQQNSIIKKGWVKKDEVWSVITLQRTKREQEDDYATWPLEIKIHGKEHPEDDEKSERIVFPAVIRNVRRGEEEEREIINMYKRVKNIIEVRGSSQGITAIKCDISLARNGEKQPWNIAC